MIPAEGSSEHPESCPKTHRQISGSLPPLSEAQEALPLLQCHPGEKETMWKTLSSYPKGTISNERK